MAMKKPMKINEIPRWKHSDAGQANNYLKKGENLEHIVLRMIQ